jgi:thiamine biosynthesis lipoprotein
MFGFLKSARPRSTQTPLTLHWAQGPTMGTQWIAQFVASAQAYARIVDQIQGAVDLVDGQMSTWKRGSDLNRFNAAPVGDWVAVPPELAFVVAQALSIGRTTSGAFDITLGAQVNAWGFGPEGMTDAPQSSQPAAGPMSVEVRSDPPALRKSLALSLDLSGIAKGYGVDLMAEVLEQAGIADYLVTLDGELRCKGRKPGSSGSWSIALHAPLPGAPRAWEIWNRRTDRLRPQATIAISEFTTAGCWPIRLTQPPDGHWKVASPRSPCSIGTAGARMLWRRR